MDYLFPSLPPSVGCPKAGGKGAHRLACNWSSCAGFPARPPARAANPEHARPLIRYKAWFWPRSHPPDVPQNRAPLDKSSLPFPSHPEEIVGSLGPRCCSCPKPVRRLIPPAKEWSRIRDPHHQAQLQVRIRFSLPAFFLLFCSVEDPNPRPRVNCATEPHP